MPRGQGRTRHGHGGKRSKQPAVAEYCRRKPSMNSRADELERQADRAIYSDDHDAIEKLTARIAALEAERERIKAVNKAVRRYGLQRLIQWIDDLPLFRRTCVTNITTQA